MKVVKASKTMVVGNTSLMQLPTACSIIPVTPFFPQLCLQAIQRFPPSILPTPVISATAPIPCQAVLPQGATIGCSPPASSPQSNTPPASSPQSNTPPASSPQPNTLPASLSVNSPHTNILSSIKLVPCAVSVTNGVTSIVPLTQGLSFPTLVPLTPKLASNQAVSTNSISPAQSSPGIHACTPLPSTGIVPCTQRVVNGQSVLQCTPGVCSITPAMLPEVIPSTVVPDTPAIYPPSLSHSSSSNLCASTAISSWKQSHSMKQVWQIEFKSLFSQYNPNNWKLFPVDTKPEGQWNNNLDSAKVRFYCEDCGHGWTSMKGRVAFWFVLNQSRGEGIVCLKLYGQQCDTCKTGNYEPAMWYPEEVLKVLVNIYNKVGQVYYGFQQAPYHREKRAGNPRTPHNSELCQACKDGVCSERR